MINRTWHKWTLAGILGALLPALGHLAGAGGKLGTVGLIATQVLGIVTALGLLKSTPPGPTQGAASADNS